MNMSKQNNEWENGFWEGFKQGGEEMEEIAKREYEKGFRDGSELTGRLAEEEMGCRLADLLEKAREEDRKKLNPNIKQ